MVNQKQMRTDGAIYVIWTVLGIWSDRELSQFGFFTKNVCNMFWVTILYKYHGETEEYFYFLASVVFPEPGGPRSRSIILYPSSNPATTAGRARIQDTVCPRSSDSFYVVTYYIKWVTTSWTYSIYHDDLRLVVHRLRQCLGYTASRVETK